MSINSDIITSMIIVVTIGVSVVTMIIKDGRDEK